jgi:ABC-type branched-subunit amino acid transport system substrate-binding protein
LEETHQKNLLLSAYLQPPRTSSFYRKDDQYDPQKTPGLAEEAIVKDGVVALLNAVGTADTVGLMKTGVLTKYKVPLVGGFSGADVIRGPGSEQIFHTRAVSLPPSRRRSF